MAMMRWLAILALVTATYACGDDAEVSGGPSLADATGDADGQLVPSDTGAPDSQIVDLGLFPSDSVADVAVVDAMDIANDLATPDSKVCVPAVDCPAAPICHTAGCTPAGDCTATAMADGTGCDDGDACTKADTCVGGTCSAGVQLNCDDKNACTDDSCDAKTGCVHSNGSEACNDNNLCTSGEACKDGGCAPGKPVVCNDGNPCTSDTCDLAIGCTSTANTLPCSDGNACTAADICSGGNCLPGGVLNCDDGKLCTTDSCDAGSGCKNAANTVICDDGDACTAGDVCADAACVAGKLVVCNDSNPCTDDKCDSKIGCVFAVNGAACSDNNACTQGDGCKGSVCLPGNATTCDDNNACSTDSCDPAKGCINLANALSCDDGNACTLGDICSGSACSAGKPLVCNDGNVCTDDSCLPKTGCNFIDNSAACDDNNACTQKDGCKGGNCVPGIPPACDDKNPCTTETCDPGQGCKNVANVLPCDDDNPCTAGDICADSKCNPGKAVVCNDGNVCTDDSCDPKQGCVFAQNVSPCDDGNQCTTADQCKGGSCSGNGQKVCEDGNLCTTDSCDSQKGCVFAKNSLPCDDGNVCTQGDMCSLASCVQGKGIICNDGNFCTDDDCDAKKGCFATNSTEDCDDGNACTKPDVCGDGKCAGVAIACDDKNVCTADYCDPTKGCQTIMIPIPCDDASLCTDGDVCVAAKCAGKAIACDDKNPCTDDKCDAGKGCFFPAAEDGTICGGVGVCTNGLCSVGTILNPGPSCAAILATLPNSISALYWLDPDGPGGGAKFQAWCEMKLGGGGWTLIAVIGTDGRPGVWTGGLYPRPGATFYGPAATAALGNILDNAKNDAGIKNYSIGAKDLFANSAKREVMAYVGGTTDDFLTVALPLTCNPFDPLADCKPNGVTGLKLVQSDGLVIATNGQMCGGFADSCGYNEFGFHLLDGAATGGCKCHQAGNGTGFQGIGRMWTSFERSDGGYWNSGVHSAWKGTFNMPGALLIR